jgi:Domain of unknown function (DUF4118)
MLWHWMQPPIGLLFFPSVVISALYGGMGPGLVATVASVMSAAFFLPATAARALFGPDGARRQLHAIEARDHSFGGARPEMYDAVEASLEWIEGLSTEH